LLAAGHDLLEGLGTREVVRNYAYVGRYDLSLDV
jgi:hypothetical protein